MSRPCRRRLPQEAREEILRAANPAFGTCFDPLTTEIFEERLPFYDRLRLYAIADEQSYPPHTRYVLMGGGSVFVPDGSDSPVRNANALEGIALKMGTVENYLAFYLKFLGGARQGLLSVQKLADIVPIRPFTTTQKNALLDHLHPMRLRETGGRNPHFLAEGCFISGNMLSRMKFAITPRGEIRIVKQALLLRDLPLGPANTALKVA